MKRVKKMGKKHCVLDDGKLCDNCSQCDLCDLDPQKTCDNCMQCIENEVDYRVIEIDEIIEDEESEDP